jgi:hypothetical protein
MGAGVITKGERVQLRALIKQRFKVLRADVKVREAELIAELEERIEARFAAEDKKWNDARFMIEEAAREANRKANDILRGLSSDYPVDTEYVIVRARHVSQPAQERHELSRAGQARIAAQVRSALLQLDRDEADLLTKLAVGALESVEARAFLGEIPTVSALVPADRLLQLEAQLRDTP